MDEYNDYGMYPDLTDYGAGYSDYTDYGNSNVIIDETGVTSPSIVTDFFAAARGKLEAVLSPQPDAKAQSTGAQLFEAIYQFGRGNVDTARSKAVSFFLGTNEGKKVQAEGTKQTLMKYFPYLLGGAVLLILLGFVIRK